MKKLMVVLFAVVALSVSSLSSYAGDFRVFGMDKDDNGNYSWSNYDLVFGVCSYKELGDRPDILNNATMGTYFQVPMVEYGNTRINFGVVFPFVEARRTRPEFSISHIFGGYLGLPKCLPLEVGAYWAASPWVGVGAQLGIFKVQF